jgi:hypothetical protein
MRDREAREDLMFERDKPTPTGTPRVRYGVQMQAAGESTETEQFDAAWGEPQSDRGRGRNGCDCAGLHDGDGECL